MYNPILLRFTFKLKQMLFPTFDDVDDDSMINSTIAMLAVRQFMHVDKHANQFANNQVCPTANTNSIISAFS